MIDVRDLQKLADEWFPPAIACDVRLASTTRLFLSRIAGHLIRLEAELEESRKMHADLQRVIAENARDTFGRMR